MLALLISALFVGALSETAVKTPGEVLKYVLNDYDRHTIPTPKPNVRSEIWIQRLKYLCPKSRELGMELFMSEYWSDSRLKFSDVSELEKIVVGAKETPKLWNPILSFTNAREYSVIAAPQTSTFTLIYSNGSVWTNDRGSLVVPCKITSMECDAFCCQKAVCTAKFESYRYSAEEVNNEIGDVIYLDDKTVGGWKVVKTETKLTKQPYPAGTWDEMSLEITLEQRSE